MILSFLAFGVALVSLIYSFNMRINREESVALENDLPVIRIKLNDVTLETIKAGTKKVKYEGNELEFQNGDELLDFEDVQIKGRGNSTWGLPKAPLQIKFKEKVDLLGFRERKTYILLANYLDYSFMRNATMFKLAEMIKEEYRVVGEFVELYIDDEYQGLYYFTTKIGVDKNTVNLKDDLGLIVEMDTLHRDTEDCYDSVAGECLTIKEAVSEDDEEKVQVAMADFVTEFSKLEAAAKDGNFRAVSEVADVESFAKYYLVSEFAVNPDAYVSSFYFYKDGVSDKIHAGPLWDFDLAFSNRQWVWGNEDFYSPTKTMFQREEFFKSESDSGKLMYYLMDIPEFRAVVDRVFREELAGQKNELLEWFDREVEKISEAALRDEAKWREEAFFEDDVRYLMDWLEKRYDYFEEGYGEKEWEFTPGVI